MATVSDAAIGIATHARRLSHQVVGSCRCYLIMRLGFHVIRSLGGYAFRLSGDEAHRLVGHSAIMPLGC